MLGDRAHLGRRTTSARAERPTRGSSRTTARRDHLRSRGETSNVGYQRGPQRGPPPLARRDRRPARDRPAAHRTTSARAERPSTRPPRPCRSAGHLRSRGETSCRNSSPSSPDGPPPLARRDPVPDQRRRRADRTTSARAERPRSRPTFPYRRPDHLRSRGETRAGQADRATEPGPPPLARRDRGVEGGADEAVRTTSARAERPRSGARPPQDPADHLRSRGETAG